MKSFLCLILFLTFESFPLKAEQSVQELLRSGRLARQEIQNTSGLERIFQEVFSVAEDKMIYKKRLNILRGHYEEADNLELSCDIHQSIEFNSYWDKAQFKRHILAALQDRGLEITMKSLASYAKKLSFDQIAFEQLSENLVDNYCSKNISLMSHRRLKRTFIRHFESKELFELPSIEGDPYFSPDLSKINSDENILEQEMYFTLELFKAFCSWGNDVENLRLLRPLVQSTVVFSTLMRDLSEYELTYDSQKKSVLKLLTPHQNFVSCEHHLCRKSDKGSFYRSIPRPLGSDRIEIDMKRIYCQDFKRKKVMEESDQKIKDEILSKRPLDEHLMVSQYIALLTKIPSFFVRSTTPKDMLIHLKYPLDHYMNNWANQEIKSLSSFLYYEEPFVLSKIPVAYEWGQKLSELRLTYEANLGEMDRITSTFGKIKMTYTWWLPIELLSWVQRQIMKEDLSDKSRRDEIYTRLERQIKEERLKVEKKMPKVPWTEKIDPLISKEVVDQLTRLKEDFNKRKMMGDLVYPVYLDIYYSPFALKYFRYQHLIDKTKIDTKLGK